MALSLSGTKILVTGGTGSFGETVSRFLLTRQVKEVRIFSRDEKKQHDLRIRLKDPRLTFIIGDVRDQDSVNGAVDGVDYVFHAAALKQVPSCDFYPLQAIYTNIHGPSNIIKACKLFGVIKAVFLSTDKAVYPINAMGMTKALMEKLVISERLIKRRPIDRSPVLCCTRYGNVMGSRGSVIPHFFDQARRNIPLTITDPDMTRFMMSLEESVSLVMHAFEHGEDGDLFVQKAPACKVIDLARAIIKITNSKSKVDIIGTRHGEKKHETLISREEMAKAEDQERYYRIKPDTRSLDYESFYDFGNTSITNSVDYTSENTQQLREEQIAKLLLDLNLDQAFLNA